MRKLPIPLLAMLSMLFCYSCNRKDKNPDIGGKGGSAILKVTPRHHGTQIDSCKVYIKYNTLDAPAGGVYDDSAKCIMVGGLPVATFSGLTNGPYYLYGFGYDPAVLQNLKGGMPYTVTNQTEQSFNIAISE